MRNSHINKLLNPEKSELDKDIIRFIHFLKNKKLYSEYVREVLRVGESKDIRPIRYSENLIKALKKHCDQDPRGFTVSSKILIWIHTRKGLEFWNSVDEEWATILATFAE